MIFGSDSQNKNLKNAASKRIDTTPRTRTSNKMAAKIATSKTSESSGSVASKTSVAPVGRAQRNDGVSDPVRGSFEGLSNAPSTVIQGNNTGYMSKSFQTARYKEKVKFKGLDVSKNFTPFKKYDKITNYSSMASKNSSVAKMNSKISIEKMFR
jgi:hypothetical protein